MQPHDSRAPSDRAAGRQREKVLELLRASAHPVDAHLVADALQIHVTTARFHLQALETQGYVRRASARPAGAGRPKLTYEPVPRLDYADIVALFATHLGGTADEREQCARRIGADLAHRVRVARLRDELVKHRVAGEEVLLCGDFNIAPDARDVVDPASLVGRTHFSPEEHAALRSLLEFGLRDCFRKFNEQPGQFTWFDYRAGALRKNEGMRIDHVYATAPLYERCVSVEHDASPRSGESPSDHIPVIAKFK